MRRSLGCTSSTTASTWSPAFTTLEGCFMRRDQVISLMWISPSTPGFEFHESAVIGDVDHAADHAAVHRIALRHGLPRVRLELLDAQRNALLGAIELEDS